VFDAVIFDCDGVLVDSEPIAGRVLADVLREHGHPLRPDEVERRFTGLAWAQVLERLALAADGPEAAALTSDYARGLGAAFEAELRPVAGVEELLAGLARPTAVASNSGRERVRHSLACAGLLDLFAEAIFTAPEMERPKPDPAVYLAAAEGLGVDPTRCAVVEDTSVGATAASRAGMTVFAYAPQGHLSGWPPRARRVRTMSELARLLSR
jgi:HAD superfamily hydrolase (TIGR01509 family)